MVYVCYRKFLIILKTIINLHIKFYKNLIKNRFCDNIQDFIISIFPIY